MIYMSIFRITQIEIRQLNKLGLINYLFSDPFRYNVVGNKYNAWTRTKPKCVKTEEWVIKGSFIWVVFQGEEGGIDKHHPSYESKND